MDKFEKIIYKDRSYYIPKNCLNSDFFKNSSHLTSYENHLLLWSELVINNNTNTLAKCRVDLNEVFDKVFSTQPEPIEDRSKTYVYTDYVPVVFKHLITKNKAYKFTPDSDNEDFGTIVNDEDEQIYICLSDCSFLGGRSWEINEIIRNFYLH